jgi:RNA-directed DNA polymerase
MAPRLLLLRDLYLSGFQFADHSGLAKKRGTKWVASRHVGSDAVLVVDLRRFYPSVTPRKVSAALRYLRVPAATSRLIARLVTTRGHLPQGACTSPVIAEIVLHVLDLRIRGLCKVLKLRHTRYGDDITVSGGVAAVRRFESKVVAIMNSERWVLKPKDGVQESGQRQTVLGFVVNRKVNVRRQYVNRTRRILRLAASGSTSVTEKQIAEFTGRVGHISQVNPKVAARLFHLLDKVRARQGSHAIPIE